MKCENNLCVYQWKGECTIEKTTIDSLGMCAQCIYPNIDEDILKQAKSKTLDQYRKED